MVNMEVLLGLCIANAEIFISNNNITAIYDLTVYTVNYIF